MRTRSRRACSRTHEKDQYRSIRKAGREPCAKPLSALADLRISTAVMPAAAPLVAFRGPLGVVGPLLEHPRLLTAWVRGAVA